MRTVYLCGVVFCFFCRMADAQTITDGEVLTTSYLEIGPYSSMLVSAGGEVHTASWLVIGGGYDSQVKVAGSGSLVEANGVYVHGRISRLLIENGGTTRCKSFSIYGDSTEGIVYPDLVNYASVTGNGSLLEISGDLSLWSPDSPGAPGLPFDLPREIPTYLSISTGGEVLVGGNVSIANGSWLNLGSGGRLTVATNFNASMHGFYYHAGSTLSVAGQVSGLALLEIGRRLETPSLLGDLEVHGVFAPGNSTTDSILEGGLAIAPNGMLEMELGGYDAGMHDRLTVTDLSILDGTLHLLFLDGFAPTNGASFDLFNWEGGVGGAFSSIDSAALSEGCYWDASSLYTTGTLSVIPEPNSLALLALFSCGFVMVRRLFP